MELKEAKVGMKVKSTEKVGNAHLSGQVGTIVEIKHEENSVLVEFDNNIRGHDGADSKEKHKDLHCWWVSPINIQLKDIWDN